MKKRIIGSFAQVRKNNELLMILRKFPPYATCWSWPGGAVKKDETLKEAVIREVKEETNVDIIVGIYLGRVDFIGNHDPSKYYRAEVYNCTPLKGEIKSGEDVYDVRWVYKDQILNLKLAKPAEEFYKTLLATSTRPINVFLG